MKGEILHLTHRHTHARTCTRARSSINVTLRGVSVKHTGCRISPTCRTEAESRTGTSFFEEQEVKPLVWHRSSSPHFPFPTRLSNPPPNFPLSGGASRPCNLLLLLFQLSPLSSFLHTIPTCYLHHLLHSCLHHHLPPTFLLSHSNYVFF